MPTRGDEVERQLAHWSEPRIGPPRRYPLCMADREMWRRSYDAASKRDADFETMSGVPLEPVYGPPDAELPGQFPYTRGPYASMYRSRLWTMRQFAGFGTAEDTNGRFKELLRAGGSGLSTAF